MPRRFQDPLGLPGLDDPAGTASTIRPTCITAMLCARYSATLSQRLAVASVEPLPAKRGLALNAGDAAQQLQDALAEGRLVAAGYADPVMRWRTCLSDNVVQTGDHS